jgi:excisionase family DNA binding protein
VSGPYRPVSSWLPLPSDFDPPHCTVNEAAAYLRSSRWTVHKLIRLGEIESFVHHGRRLIIFGSVKRHVAATKKGHKRPRGRPRKALKEQLAEAPP